MEKPQQGGEVMSRPRTLKTMVERINDCELTNLWTLRRNNYGYFNSEQRANIRRAVRRRVAELRHISWEVKNVDPSKVAMTHPQWATMTWQAQDSGDMRKVINLVFALEVSHVV